MKKIPVLHWLFAIIIFVAIFVVSIFFYGFPSLYFLELFLLTENLFNCLGEACLGYGTFIGSLTNAVIGLLVYFTINRRIKRG